MANFRYTPFVGSVDTEFEFTSLYLHHNPSGPSPTQSDIIHPNNTTGWGSTIVNNWTVYDGVGPDAKLVAHAQGLCIYAGSWHNTFTIRFEIERFKKSTLEVMGISVDEEGEWSIVGGTGELAMARGVIKRKVHMRTNVGNIIELTMHGFCCSKMSTSAQSGSSGGSGTSVIVPEKPTPPQSGSSGGGGSSVVVPEKPAPPQSGSSNVSESSAVVPEKPTQITVLKGGPWGRKDAGCPRELTKMPRRLESVTIRYYGAIDAFSFTYIDQDGRKQTVGPWCSGWKGDGTQIRTFTLGPSESLKQVSGIYEQNTGILLSVTFLSNIRTYGPFGGLDGQIRKETAFKFSVNEVNKSSIVGFYGTTDDYIRSFGVYTL